MPRETEPLALVIDLGSSSVRAGLWRPDGRPVRGTHREVEAPLNTERPGEATIDPRALLRHVDDAIDEIVAEDPRLLERIRIATVSCFLHSFVQVDERGRPLGRVQTWADTRAAAGARELREDLDPDATWHRTGCPLAASYWPARVRQVGSPAGARFAGAAELVLQHLTGSLAVARNLAAGTGLLDRRTGDWDGPLLEALGLVPAVLPGLVEDGADVGALTRIRARRWPALAKVRWIAPWGDAATSNVGLGAVDSSRAAVNVGTSSALRSLLPRQPDSLPRGLFAFRLFDHALVGGQLSEGGGVLDWVARVLGRSRKRIDDEAGRLEPVEHGLVALPWLAGQRGLDYRDDARGVIAGLSMATDGLSLYRAVAESIGLGLAAVDERLVGLLGSPPRIVAGGGAVSKPEFLAQIIADALGRPVEIPKIGEATGRGAALLSFHGVGALDAGHVPRVKHVVTPDASVTGRYADARVRQAQLARRMFD